MTSKQEDAQSDVVHIDFAPQGDPAPVYDGPSGVQLNATHQSNHHPSGCITAAQAAAAAQSWGARRQREWDEIITAEATERDYPTPEELRQQYLNWVEQRIERLSTDAFRCTTTVEKIHDRDFDTLLTQLSRLHRNIGLLLRACERRAGRDYLPPSCAFDSLDLEQLGGYVTCPKTGKKMDPFDSYRSPIPNQ